MQNGPKTFVSTRQSKPAGSFRARPSSGHRVPPAPSRMGQRNYERYLALAQEEARSGNIVGQKTTTNTQNIISD
jgi:hypothetical protein